MQSSRLSPPRRARRGAAVLAVALGMTSVTGCGDAGGSGGTPGVTDDSVSIGISAGVTGPVASVAEPFIQGIELYFDHVNAEGGVHGRDVELVVADDGYDTARAVSNTRKFLADESVFGLIGFTAQFEAVRQLTCDADVPALFSASIEASGSCYKLYPGPDGTLVASARYLAETEGEDALERIALFAQNDDYGASAKVAAETIAERYGSELKTFTIERGASDATSQAGQIADFEPTAILMGSITPLNALLLTALGGAGVDTTDVHVVGHDTIDATVIDLAGGAAEGAIGVSSVLDPGDTSDPQVAQFVEDQKEFAPDMTVLPYTLIGYAAAQGWVAGLEAAGEDLTREGWLDAVAELAEVPSTQGPMDFAADGQLLTDLVQIVQVRDGELAYIASQQPTTLD
jgi:branched-chain amino acid transport system substrate-binding protein